MYSELLARAQVISIQQELERQVWTRRWRALGRSRKRASNRRLQALVEIIRPKAGLPEGR